MIPNNLNYEEEMVSDLTADFEITEEPSLTYAMNLEKNIYVGKVDDVEAVKQAVTKIINTERYDYEIYSWAYGIELKNLYGQPLPFVMSEVKRRITDALIVDDRIESVEDFTVEKVGKNTLHCAFTVYMTNGENFEMEREVEV